MLHKIKVIFDPIIRPLFAVYLGYGFADTVLKSFIPDAWIVPSIVLSIAGFFYILRWLATEDAPRQIKPKAVPSKLAQSSFVSKGKKIPIEVITAHAATKRTTPKLEGCTGRHGVALCKGKVL